MSSSLKSFIRPSVIRGNTCSPFVSSNPSSSLPQVLLPLVACSALAAPQHLLAAGIPALHGAVVSHEVKAHVPEGITLKDASGVIPLGGLAHAAVAVPGYSVDGELRQIHQEFAAPAPVTTDVNALPVIGAHLQPISYTTTGHLGALPTFLHAGVHAAAVEIPEVKAVEVDAPTVLAAAPLTVASLAYSAMRPSVLPG